MGLCGGDENGGGGDGLGTVAREAGVMTGLWVMGWAAVVRVSLGFMARRRR